MLKRQGDGIALSFQTGYEQAFNHGAQVDGDANQFGFGPIVELAKGPFLLTLNPLFTKQIGTFADQEGLGFEYGWRGEYDFTKRWGIGVEMFGEIEDLANAGPFNRQVHSIGPTLFYNFGGDEDEAKGGDEDGGKAKAGGRQRQGKRTRADGVLNECRCPVWLDRCNLRHCAEIPRLTGLLRGLRVLKQERNDSSGSRTIGLWCDVHLGSSASVGTDPDAAEERSVLRRRSGNCADRFWKIVSESDRVALSSKKRKWVNPPMNSQALRARPRETSCLSPTGYPWPSTDTSKRF